MYLKTTPVRMQQFWRGILSSVNRPLLLCSRTWVSKASGEEPSFGQRFDYFLVVDFEATCDRGRQLEPQEIIEFPVLKVNARNFQIESRFHRYVRPVYHPELTSFCTNLTGIIQDMVDSEDTFDQVMRHFDQWLLNEGLSRQTFTFVTCGDWDLSQMLPEQCRIWRMPVPDYFKSWINIKNIFAELTDKFPRTLPDMTQHFKLPLHGHLHSGIDDCYNIARLLEIMAVRHGCQMKVTSRLK